MASHFSSSERFRVTMVSSDGASERVTVQLSLEGLKVLTGDGSRTMRSYNLRNVSSWDLMDTSTVIWTKSEVDLEERALTLSGDATTIRNVVDTLASCCMQLAEVIRDKEEGRHLEELAAGGGKTRKAAKLPAVDSVEYWRGADKSGWLQAQGDVMKMWRRRWFVLKQGYLFRFLGPDVSESVRPRGVVDLSKVQDVRDGRSVTGKANTIQLKTASGGSVCYVCESETEMVEWISALEGAVAKIVKQLAGLDDGSEHASSSSSRSHHNHSSSSRSESQRHRSSSDRRGGDRGSSSASDWAKQVERSLSQGSRGGGGGGSNMVSVVGYNGLAGSGGGGRASAPPVHHSSHYDGAGAGAGGGGITSYSQIAGIAGVASALDDLTLNYGGFGGAGGAAGGAGGSYGAATPYGSAPVQSYGSSMGPPVAQQQQQQYGGGGYGGGAAAGGYGGAPDGGGYGGGAAYGPSSSSYGEQAAAGSYGAANGYGSYGAPPPQQQQQYAAAPPGAYDTAAAGYYQQQPPPQQQQPPPVSLIDQVPTQQPAYPYYYQQPPAGAAAAAVEPGAPPPTPPAATAPAQPLLAQSPAGAAAAAPAGGSWQVHHTPEGRPYYYDASTGVTQWEAPPGVAAAAAAPGAGALL